MITSLNRPRNMASGIAEGVYISLVSQFATGGIQNPTGAGVIISENHLFPTGTAGFLSCSLAPGKNSFSSKMLGDLMGQKMEFELKVFVPGSYAEQHFLIGNLLNQRLIVLFRDSQCPNELWYQIGSSCSPAYLVHTFTTGTEKDGVKGYEVTVQALGTAVVMYTGQVKIQEDYPNNGTPVFLTNNIDNTSITTMRGYYLAAVSKNITTIHNLALAGQQIGAVNVAYRDTAGGITNQLITTADISTFAKFVAVLQNLLPAGRTLSIYGTGLLVIHAGSVEHYLAIEIIAVPQFLIDEDNGFLIDEDGGRLLLQ